MKVNRVERTSSNHLSEAYHCIIPSIGTAAAADGNATNELCAYNNRFVSSCLVLSRLVSSHLLLIRCQSTSTLVARPFQLASARLDSKEI